MNDPVDVNDLVDVRVFKQSIVDGIEDTKFEFDDDYTWVTRFNYTHNKE